MGYAISVCTWGPDRDVAARCLEPTLYMNGYNVNSVTKHENGEWELDISRYGIYDVVFYEYGEKIILARLEWRHTPG